MDEAPLIDDTIENVYCFYSIEELSKTKYLDFKGLMITNNNYIINYKFLSLQSDNITKDLNDCFMYVYRQMKETDTKKWETIINNVLKPKAIYFVELPYAYTWRIQDYFNYITDDGKLNENITKNIKKIEFYGDGLNKNYNSRIYDSIKDFINFRKDTKETLYYLLQRIITLEKNMKNVQNKLVANDIKTHIKIIILN